jgi:hypothetical protein
MQNMSQQRKFYLSLVPIAIVGLLGFMFIAGAFASNAATTQGNSTSSVAMPQGTTQASSTSSVAVPQATTQGTTQDNPASSVALIQGIKQGNGASDSCVDNGFLTAQVQDATGIYSFQIGTCASSTCVNPASLALFPTCNNILYPLGTSFLTVADFTTGNIYTEEGEAGATSLGTPTSSTVVGDSIVTVFPATAEGLIVTQTITVSGTTAADSIILHSVTVQNTNPTAQKVGVRYLWDTQVGGYDGTWLQQYDGSTAGAITGNETDYNPPSASFTSYAMGGCSQGPVTPPPYTCLPTNFGPASGTFTVFGSISSGPGATNPARFVYVFWDAAFGSQYAYTANPLHEIGSYVPNNGGSQDSAMLYYFANQTLTSGQSLSDQADISNVQNAVVPTIPTVTTQLSQTPITAGDAVTDSATISGGSSPTGTVSFFYSSSNSCPASSGAVQIGSPIAVSGNSVYSSVSQTFLTPGTYYVYATYSGDSNNAAVTSACEPLVVTPAASTSTSSSTSTVTSTTTITATSTATSTSTSTATITSTGTTTTTEACELVAGTPLDLASEPTTSSIVTSTTTITTTVTTVTTTSITIPATVTITTCTTNIPSSSSSSTTSSSSSSSSSSTTSSSSSSSTSTTVTVPGVPQFGSSAASIAVTAIALLAVAMIGRRLRPVPITVAR